MPGKAPTEPQSEERTPDAIPCFGRPPWLGLSASNPELALSGAADDKVSQDFFFRKVTDILFFRPHSVYASYIGFSEPKRPGERLKRMAQTGGLDTLWPARGPSNSAARRSHTLDRWGPIR